MIVARSIGVSDVGGALGVPYFSHLPGDAPYPAIMPGVTVDLGYLIWPFAPGGHADTQGLLARVVELAGEFSQFVTGPGG